jgi:hypothetical protein
MPLANHPIDWYSSINDMFMRQISAKR